MQSISIVFLLATLFAFTFHAFLYLKSLTKYDDTAENQHAQQPEYPHKQQKQQQPILDDLVWYVAKPTQARSVGWEDDWMTQFKQSHYDPNQKLRLERTLETPYDTGDSLIDFPAYIPARIPLPTNTSLIPRVIFMCWKTRRLGRRLFLSLLSILNHNPEYELVLFNDADINRFVCDNFRTMAPFFGRLKAGAARADVWRMMIIFQYGGVYLDMDLSSIAHLPIPPDASGFSGVGDWSHLPASSKGVLEHWALAFEPRHKLIETTLQLLLKNLKDPDNPYVTDARYVEAERSFTIRFTGPAVYQRALQMSLRKAKCKWELEEDKDEPNFINALFHPEIWCDETAFHQEFGNFVAAPAVEMDRTLTNKAFPIFGPETYWEWRYDRNSIFPTRRDEFCNNLALRARQAENEWKNAINKKKG